MEIQGADPEVGKGRGTNRLNVARWLRRIELNSYVANRLSIVTGFDKTWI